MNGYRCNPRCGCARCQMSGMMGPAVLVTLGVLFLLGNFAGHRYGFHTTWPLLLIVIGIVKVLQYTASTEAHRAPEFNPPVPPPAAPPSQQLPPAQSGGEVRNV